MALGGTLWQASSYLWERLSASIVAAGKPLPQEKCQLLESSVELSLHAKETAPMNSNQCGVNTVLALFLILLLGGLGGPAALAQAAPEGKFPVVITSCGQSPDGFILKMLCDRNKLKVTYNSLLKVDELKEFKSLMVVMGGSAKGLGAAGIDEPQELQRVQNVMAKAKEQKTTVFGLHMGGEARRGKLSAPFVEQVSPRCDYLIVTEDGNKDGYFTALSKEKQIPLMVVKDTQELGALLKKIFGAN
jgi:hypothetical protein